MNKEHLFTYIYINIDSPNITLPDVNEEKIAKRKWLIDVCLQYVDKFILNVNEIDTLVTQTCELHSRLQVHSKCRYSNCDNTYVYHSGRVK